MKRFILAYAAGLVVAHQLLGCAPPPAVDSVESDSESVAAEIETTVHGFLTEWAIRGNGEGAVEFLGSYTRRSDIMPRAIFPDVVNQEEPLNDQTVRERYARALELIGPGIDDVDDLKQVLSIRDPELLQTVSREEVDIRSDGRTDPFLLFRANTRLAHHFDGGIVDIATALEPDNGPVYILVVDFADPSRAAVYDGPISFFWTVEDGDWHVQALGGTSQ